MGKAFIKNLGYWRFAFNPLPTDKEIEQRKNQREWDEYWKDQYDRSISTGLMTKDEADKHFKGLV